jgi:hypothetical protein
VVAFYPVHVVVEGVVAANPACKRGGPGAEIAGNGRGQIGAGRRLPEVLHSVPGDVLASRRSATEGDFTLPVEDQVIQQVRCEDVGLGKRRVVVTGIKVRPVAGQISGVVNGRLAEPVLVVVAKEVIGGAELAIDAGDVLVVSIDRGLCVSDRASDFPGSLRAGERGKSLLVVHRSRIEVGGRYPVERIGHVGEWIVNLLGRVIAHTACSPAGGAQIAKIGIGLAGATFFSKGWNRSGRGVRSLVNHRPLIAEEELGAASFGNVGDDDRPADGAAKLIAVEVIRRDREKRPGVEVAIAQELKRVSMKAAGTGFGDDVDHRAGALTIRGVVVAGLNAEFLHRVGERKRRIDVCHFIHVVAAVQEVGRLVGQRSVGAGDDRSGKCLSITLVDPVALVGGVAYAGNERDQRCCISAVQRKINDAALVDNLRQRAGGGVHLRHFGRNR